ncbi:exopolysaccharide biosynthesis protein [soil metagenome]
MAPAEGFMPTLTALGAKSGAKLCLGDVLEAFGDRGFGAALLLLGLFNTLPLPPGSSTVLGLPILLVSAQLAWGRQTLSLPAWITRRAISGKHYRSLLKRLSRPVTALEAATRPRLTLLVNGTAERFVGLVVALLAIILMLPLWGGNLIPAVIVSVFGLGLMQRDGCVVLLGWIAVVGLGIVVWLVSGWVFHAALLAWDRSVQILL